MEKINTSDSTQERQPTRVRKLQNDCTNKSLGKSNDGNTDRKTKRGDRGAHGRRTGGVQKRQKHCTTNTSNKTDRRKSQEKKHQNIQLLYRLQKSFRQHRPKHNMGSY